MAGQIKQLRNAIVSLSLTLGLLITGHAHAVTISPTAQGHIREVGGSVIVNTPTIRVIRSELNQTTIDNEFGFIEFALPSLTSVSSASFSIVADSNFGLNETTTISLDGYAGNGFLSASDLNEALTPIVDFTVDPFTQTVFRNPSAPAFSFDVTGFVNSLLSTSEGFIGFRLSVIAPDPSPFAHGDLFVNPILTLNEQSDDGTDPPSPVPLPASLPLLLCAIFGLGLTRLRKPAFAPSTRLGN